jgi:hypothetical protein
MSTEIAQTDNLLDVTTGEVLPATVPNAATVLHAARLMKDRVNDIIAETTAWLVREAAHQGTKTLRAGKTTVTVSGGSSTEYDPHDLMEALREAGCPEDRIEQAVVPEVSFKINRSVLRQLAGANPDYRAAIELAEREVERPYRASVKEA